MANDIGQGSTISFGGILTNSNSATTFKVNNIQWSGMQRDVVDASHMLTSGGKDFVASEIYDPGEISVEIHYDPSVNPVTPLTNATTAQVVYMRFASGGSSTYGWSSYGFMSGFEAGVPKDDMMTGTITIKLSGSVATAS